MLTAESSRNIDQYIQMHKAGYFPGNSTAKWSDDIQAMLERHNAKDVLDYGSGKGAQYSRDKLHHKWKIEQPHLYEPAVPELAKLPDRNFEAVICCDVLEHLEGMELYECILNVLTYADKCAFFAITCRPAGKSLPDGRNCHITIQSPMWWRGYIQAIIDRVVKHNIEVVLVFEE